MQLTKVLHSLCRSWLLNTLQSNQSQLCLIAYTMYQCYLVIGWYKITKKLWKPNHIPNNELIDFLSRAPTNLELVSQYVPVVYH